MSDDVHAAAREPRRLASVFDQFPPGTPLSLDDLERAMSHDIERRSLAALDRPTSTYSAAGRIKFPEDARGLARERGALGVRFDAATRGRIPQPRNSPGSMGLVRFGS